MLFTKSIPLIFSLIIVTNILAAEFIYKVKDGDNLSTIIYSSSDDELNQSIKGTN